MKKSFLAFAIAAASLPAFAQVGADSNSSAGATATLGNIGITSIMNMPASNPFSTTANMVNYSGRYRVDGVPVNSVASSFSSAPTWRCVKGGYGAALQAKDFGISLALPGGESDICPTEFRASIVANYFDRVAAADALSETDVRKTAALDAVVAIRNTICTDEQIANSLEATKKHQCAQPLTTEDRKARWAREAKARQAQATLSGQTVPVADAAPRQPMPWQAGG